MTFYFRHIPNLEYINLSSEDEQISNFTQVKNLFKRGKIREDIFANLAFFEKYNIIGDERPDNIAEKVYGDSTLDWIVLLSNNIVNVYDEWPMPQESYDKYLLEKYKSYEALYAPHHYESLQVRDSLGRTVLKSGLIVPQIFNFKYFDSRTKNDELITGCNITVSNYEYEERIENQKRNIFLLKGPYAQIIANDLETKMPYKKGGEQYVSPTLKRVDNIRLYES